LISDECRGHNPYLITCSPQIYVNLYTELLAMCYSMSCIKWEDIFLLWLNVGREVSELSWHYVLNLLLQHKIYSINLSALIIHQTFVFTSCIGTSWTWGLNGAQNLLLWLVTYPLYKPCLFSIKCKFWAKNTYTLITIHLQYQMLTLQSQSCTTILL
jgi:hypothetical protein